MENIPPGTPVQKSEPSIRDKQLAADSARAKALILAMMKRNTVYVSRIQKDSLS